MYKTGRLQQYFKGEKKKIVSCVSAMNIQSRSPLFHQYHMAKVVIIFQSDDYSPLSVSSWPQTCR